MKKSFLVKRFLSFLILAGCGVAVNSFAAASQYASPESVVSGPQGKVLYIAEFTGESVAVFNLDTRKVEKRIALKGRPSGLAVSPDGRRLYVTLSAPEGRVEVIDLARGKSLATVAVGHSPTAPVLSPNGQRLYVCNRFNNDVSVIDLGGMQETQRIPVVREPVAAAVTPDGKSLLVANHLPSAVQERDYASSVVSIIDTENRAVVGSVFLPNGSNGLRGICVSPDGKYAYVTHVLARYQMPTTQLERGWMNTNALSVIDVAARERVNTVLLDDVDLGAANPWAVACSEDGALIVVSHAGTHELSVIERVGLHRRLEKAARGERVNEATKSAEDVPNDLSFLVGLHRRLSLSGNGPRGMVLVGERAWVTEYFTDSLAVVDLLTSAKAPAKSISLGEKHPLTAERRGEMLFNDADLCFQKWQSCVSCHPGARADALTWDLLNDGIGNPKNTKSMLLSHETPPVMVTGIRASAEVAVRAGIRYIQFARRPEEDAAAIDAYLKSLKPVPSPWLVGGKLSESAQRGETAFQKAACNDCHSGPLMTDMRSHDIGLGKGIDKGRKFDTSSLIEVWRTAPYLYDGRAATMQQVLKEHNRNDQHGRTSTLSEQELEDLARFVLSK